MNKFASLAKMKSKTEKAHLVQEWHLWFLLCVFCILFRSQNDPNLGISALHSLFPSNGI